MYYIVAVSEASSNLSRFDGVRFGSRLGGNQYLLEMYKSTRAKFGEEVKRRIILGTFALSAGYYDAYYRKACQVRRLIKNDFDQVFEKVDLVLGPVAPTTAFKLGEKTADPLMMYLNDILTIPVNLAGLPAVSVPAGRDSSGLPIGVQFIGRHFAEADVLAGAKFVEDKVYREEVSHGLEPVIGLEVHAQLLTKSKLFCGCSTEFNSPANSNVCPVCAGHPGTLPVINGKAVEFALKAALALDCTINRTSVFSRKNYFYPDLPKGYQISQYDQPLCENGHLDIEVAGRRKRIGITRIHMEEDAGKSVHMQGYSLVNLNRAATPLTEIVSNPELSSPEEAGAYLRQAACGTHVSRSLRRQHAGRQLSLRRERVRAAGGTTKLGTRAEIKNVNSFRFVEKAIEYEINRQVQLIQSGGHVVQETRTYDSGRNATVSMRGKEEAHDYRYFPEPDLIPLVVSEARIAELKTTLPELPDQKQERFVREMGLTSYDAGVITSTKRLAQFFEEAAAFCGEPKIVANWVMGELLRLLKSDDREVDELTMKPTELGALIKMIKAGTISTTIAKTVFEEMYGTGRAAETIVRDKGLMQISDTSAILKIIDGVLEANPAQVADFKAGKDKLFGFLVGQVMKQMAGKANPAVVNELLKKKLSQ